MPTPRQPAFPTHLMGPQRAPPEWGLNGPRLGTLKSGCCGPEAWWRAVLYGTPTVSWHRPRCGMPTPRQPAFPTHLMGPQRAPPEWGLNGRLRWSCGMHWLRSWSMRPCLCYFRNPCLSAFPTYSVTQKEKSTKFGSRVLFGWHAAQGTRLACGSGNASTGPALGCRFRHLMCMHKRRRQARRALIEQLMIRCNLLPRASQCPIIVPIIAQAMV